MLLVDPAFQRALVTVGVMWLRDVQQTSGFTRGPAFGTSVRRCLADKAACRAPVACSKHSVTQTETVGFLQPDACLTYKFKRLPIATHHSVHLVRLRAPSHGLHAVVRCMERRLSHTAQACRSRGLPVIFDEVMTGLMRLGAPSAAGLLGVAPDIGCYAKLMTAGTVPMAATLATEGVFDSFSGDSKVGVRMCATFERNYTAS